MLQTAGIEYPLARKSQFNFNDRQVIKTKLAQQFPQVFTLKYFNINKL